MKKIGITGSIASGKTTASKIISYKRGPVFSADDIVKKLYKQIKFQRLIKKKLKLESNKNFKQEIKKQIFKNNASLTKLEKIVHPAVRKEMNKFILRNKNKKMLFFEIPLLIESNLKKYFDVVIFIRSKKKIRLNRYRRNNGNERLFKLLSKHQLKDIEKMKFCDFIVVNNKSLNVLKKKLLNIINLYD